MPPSSSGTTDPRSYATKREKAAERSRRQVRLGQDIAPIPAVADPDRRARADNDFRFFCEAYFPQLFTFAWSDDHLRVIAKIEQSVIHDQTFSVAMPRGSGKTTLCMVAVIWAVLTGRHQFVFLITPTDDAATKILDNIKVLLRTNDLLYADYPEAIHPIRKLEGESRKCSGQRLYGVLTGIEMMAGELTFATVPGAKCSGAIIRTAGITGHIRGPLKARADGTLVRPSLAVLDDPQTDSSARSPSQCAERLSLIKGAVQGMAGPGKRIAILMPCTVIRADDVADTLLDPKKNPQWNGERTKMVTSFPTNEALWDQYEELFHSGPTGKQIATQFYAQNRAAMDEGSVVAWKERFEHDELSAIQSAMNIKFGRGERVFFAEYQNEPLPDVDLAANALTAEQIAQKLNGLKRGIVPSGAIHLTAFADVQGDYIWWMVCAWEQFFSGAIIDYGTEPDQRVAYYTTSNAKRTLAQAAPKAGFEGAIGAGLERACDYLLGREWVREDGSVMRISRMLIDAGWGPSTQTIETFCRRSKHSATVRPSFGKGITAGSSPMSQWPKKLGERHGFNWLEKPSKSGGRHVLIDTNHWKTFVAARLTTVKGDPGSVTLYGHKAETHQLLIDHLLAEYAEATDGPWRRVDEWKKKPSHDNEGFDALVGNAVAASMLGVTVKGGEQGNRKRVSLRELYDKAKGRRVARQQGGAI